MEREKKTQNIFYNGSHESLQCANEFITSHHLKWHPFLTSTEAHQFPGSSGSHAPLLSLNAEYTIISLI